MANIFNVSAPFGINKTKEQSTISKTCDKINKDVASDLLYAAVKNEITVRIKGMANASSKSLVLNGCIFTAKALAEIKKEKDNTIRKNTWFSKLKNNTELTPIWVLTFSIS